MRPESSIFNVTIHKTIEKATIPVKAENKELALQSIEYLLENHPEELVFTSDNSTLITCKEVESSDKN